jgi:RimJ/RimL family protein N-acetyltransferase
MIKTERIYLERFREDDTDLLFQLDGDADVMKYITLGVSRTIEEVIEKSMPRILKSYQENSDFGIFAAYLNNSDKYIGWFQFEKDKEFKDAIEIGWRLKKQHWGNGYATELAIAFSKMGIEMGKTIVARAMIENLASIRVMEKAGLEFEKEFWGDYEPHSGNPDVLYQRQSST